jgi:hypothetical protein
MAEAGGYFSLKLARFRRSGASEGRCYHPVKGSSGEELFDRDRRYAATTPVSASLTEAAA